MEFSVKMDLFKVFKSTCNWRPREYLQSFLPFQVSFSPVFAVSQSFKNGMEAG